MYTTLIHWVARGIGTPKDEVNRREVCECDGWVWVCKPIGSPSQLSVMCKVTNYNFNFTRMLTTVVLRCEENATRWKWNWSRSFCVNWTPEDKKNRPVSRWTFKRKSLTNSLCNLPDVLTIVDINETDVRWVIIVFSSILSDLVSGILIEWPIYIIRVM
jgi:hypothetical protein